MGEHNPVIHIRSIRDFPNHEYIGRPRVGQPWRFGNPFRHSPEYPGFNPIYHYREWLVTSSDPRAKWQRANMHTLRGKALVCFCSPGPCHGDVIARILDEAESWAANGTPWASAVEHVLANWACKPVGVNHD